MVAHLSGRARSVPGSCRRMPCAQGPHKMLVTNANGSDPMQWEQGHSQQFFQRATQLHRAHTKNKGDGILWAPQVGARCNRARSGRGLQLGWTARSKGLCKNV